MSDKHPVIVYSLGRKVIGAPLYHTLVLTASDFYEELDDYDWAGTEFQFGVQDSDNSTLPDGPGLWTAEFRIEGDPDSQEHQLVQESPWRTLTDKEAVLFAQGLPIEEVLAVRTTSSPGEEVWGLQKALEEERERNKDLSRWLRDAQQRANELDKQINNRQNVIDDLREQIAEELNQEPHTRRHSTPP